MALTSFVIQKCGPVNQLRLLLLGAPGKAPMGYCCRNWLQHIMMHDDLTSDVISSLLPDTSHCFAPGRAAKTILGATVCCLIAMPPERYRYARVLFASITLFKVAHAFTGALLLQQHTRTQKNSASTSPATQQAGRWTMMSSNSFRTEVHIPMWPEHTQLGYADSFFLLGSCFSDNISAHLSRAKLPTSLNPAHGGLLAWILVLLM